MARVWRGLGTGKGREVDTLNVEEMRWDWLDATDFPLPVTFLLLLWSFFCTMFVRSSLPFWAVLDWMDGRGMGGRGEEVEVRN